ncbi:MAG: HAMP domain-containing histidine kinase [Clostridia bacterium]|nr:HAMP domain-containing histidine kinase [Clostridia bacterium]
MKLFNNPEIKKFGIFYFVISLIFCSISYLIEPFYALISLVFSVLSVILFFAFTKHRYSKIKKITDTIDLILQGKEILSINKFKEGELSILETQLEKMFLRLSEQKEILKKEKSFLADAIADLSHQLRTPLTSINLILTLLSEQEITQERKNELLRELSSLINRTEKLVTTLLKISKIDAGTIQFKKQTIDVPLLIEKAAEPLMIAMDIKNQELSIDADKVNFEGDFLWYTEALSNILKNAVEHTPDGGKVYVKAENNPLYTEIVITNTGSGFTKEDLPHIFERFYKGKNTSKDSFGIGLNLARTVIHNQNGTIKAENVPVGGARFTIKIYNSN